MADTPAPAVVVQNSREVVEVSPVLAQVVVPVPPVTVTTMRNSVSVPLRAETAHVQSPVVAVEMVCPRPSEAAPSSSSMVSPVAEPSPKSQVSAVMTGVPVSSQEPLSSSAERRMAFVRPASTSSPVLLARGRLFVQLVIAPVEAVQ
jgi:hypothetical protein